MSIWSDIQDRSAGITIREEDIHKASLLIKKVGGAEKLSGFYTKDEILFKLNHEQQQSLRWHRCELVLNDERFKRRALYRLGVLSPLGDTGETIVQDAIDKVEKEYGYFDGYTCDEEMPNMHKYVSEKNKKMIDEIRGILDKHGMVLLGWKNLIRYRRAVSAELIKDLYYDSDGSDGNELRVLRSYGAKKDTEIGLYKVTFEWYRKKQNEEIVIKTKDDKLYAAIGTDVVDTWQKLNDEYVRVNGNWSLFVSPSGTPPGDVDIYSYNDFDIQLDKFKQIKRGYYDTLCKEHQCKIGTHEAAKLSEKYWDDFTVFLTQKDMDIIKNDVTTTFSQAFKVIGIDDFNYVCMIYPGTKTPRNSIAVSIRLDDLDEHDRNLARFEFIEERFKTQIEALHCTEVNWRKEKSISFIDVILDADFWDKSDWPRQMEWMYNTLMGLHKILQPHYGTIRGIK